MTPTETALVLLLMFGSGAGGWAVGQAGKPAPVQRFVDNSQPGLVQRAPAAICPPCPAVVLQPRAPACGQHARFDPVELEYHKARLAAGVFSRIEPEATQQR